MRKNFRNQAKKGNQNARLTANKVKDFLRVNEIKKGEQIGERAGTKHF